MVRNLIEEDVGVSKSVALGEYETKIEGEGTSSKSPVGAKKSEAGEGGVEKKLEKLKEELLAELKSQAGVPTNLRMSPPFVTQIQEEITLKKFPTSAMTAYDGTGNPKDHMINYKTFTKLQPHSNALLYKVFPISLTRVALTWFNNLEAESIKTFGNLENSFMGRFIASVSTQWKTNYLEMVKQRRDENLWEYVAHFNIKAL